MNGPSTRILELLSLLQDGRTWDGAELARRVGASPRTLRRDLDRLRELGYPVESARGPGGGYRLAAGRAVPPLLFTDDEAVAAVVGLRFAALTWAGADTGVADSALAKLERVLPDRLRHRVRAVSASMETGSRPHRQADLGVLRLLGGAASGRNHVRFHYTSRSGAETDRRVEPYAQVLFAHRWYLLGWDRDRDDWRTFRADRISGLEVLGTAFAPRPLPPGGAVSFVQDSARLPITRHRATVLFRAPLQVVSERLVAEAGELTAVDAESCRYVSAPDSWEWLAITLATVGVPYTVEGPPELIEVSRALAGRIARAAGG
ncbi:YafY family transcriptional regulator [Nocardiopsis sp. CNT-189]|uniref:helix-turn-helix transcriptional regulator n=1 Tax=Nocardiopsis oceanisediminis TaxID=2816862 RepID=UPI003B2E496D